MQRARCREPESLRTWRNCQNGSEKSETSWKKLSKQVRKEWDKLEKTVKTGRKRVRQAGKTVNTGQKRVRQAGKKQLKQVRKEWDKLEKKQLKQALHELHLIMIFAWATAPMFPSFFVWSWTWGKRWQQLKKSNWEMKNLYKVKKMSGARKVKKIKFRNKKYQP